MNAKDREQDHADPRPWKAEDLLALAQRTANAPSGSSSTRACIERFFDQAGDAARTLDTAQTTDGVWGDKRQGPSASSVLHQSGTQPSAPPVDVPNHQLISCLGVGGFGQVWMARQRLTGHYRACKLVPEAKSVELDGLRHLKGRVPSHQGLLPIDDVGAVEGWLYCLMPLAESATGSILHDASNYEPMTLAVYAARGRPPIAEIASIVASLADAAAHLHAHGVTHGDIKPQNILRLEGRWVLGDFGLMRNLTRPEGAGRTPGYIPEGETPGSPAADRFALGVVLMELLAVRRPDLLEEVRSTPAETFGLDETGQRLFGVMLRATSPQPENRYGSAAELAAAVRDAARSDAAIPPPGVSRGLLVALAVIAPLALAGAIFMRSQGSERPETPSTTVAPADESPQTSTPSIAPGKATPVRIESFEVRHYRYDPAADTLVAVGPLGADNPAARDDDDVTLHARFSDPAYAYLVSFDTDGVVRLRHPERPTDLPAEIDRIDYPSLPTGSEEDLVFNLGLGPGTQAFMLLVSQTPLPTWSEWFAARGNPILTTEALPADRIYTFDGKLERHYPATRAPRPLRGTLANDPVNWLRSQEDLSAVFLLSFPVLPGQED